MQTIQSLHEADEETWEAIGKELEGIGITVEEFEAKKEFIMNWLQEAIVNGDLEEQAVSDSAYSSDSEAEEIPTHMTIDPRPPATTRQKASPRIEESKPAGKPQRRKTSGLISLFMKIALAPQGLARMAPNPLVTAFKEGDVVGVQHMSLEKHIDLNARYSVGRTALFYAINNKQACMVHGCWKKAPIPTNSAATWAVPPNILRFIQTSLILLNCC